MTNKKKKQLWLVEDMINTNSNQQQRGPLWSFLHLKAKVLLLWITMKEWGETSRKIDYLISHITFYVTFQCMFPAITFESRGSSQVEDERDSISISTIYSLW